ncbi:MAG TPA: hypothetical protein VGK24_05600 [Candidatus Angelobacter sp.]|jgi:hypothetical protein
MSHRVISGNLLLKRYHDLANVIPVMKVITPVSWIKQKQKFHAAQRAQYVLISLHIALEKKSQSAHLPRCFQCDWRQFLTAIHVVNLPWKN